jgi:hypothetical protein
LEGLNAGFRHKPAFKTPINQHVASLSIYKAFVKTAGFSLVFSLSSRHSERKRLF